MHYVFNNLSIWYDGESTANDYDDDSNSADDNVDVGGDDNDHFAGKCQDQSTSLLSADTERFTAKCRC